MLLDILYFYLLNAAVPHRIALGADQGVLMQLAFLYLLPGAEGGPYSRWEPQVRIPKDCSMGSVIWLELLRK